MIHPIPPGTRDVLPEEMRELRRLQAALIEVFEGKGYGEVATPALEYDEVLSRGTPVTLSSRMPVFCLRDESVTGVDRKSTRLNSSHTLISYAVFFLHKKTDRM